MQETRNRALLITCQSIFTRRALFQEFHGHFVFDVDLCQCFTEFLESNREISIGILNGTSKCSSSRATRPYQFSNGLISNRCNLLVLDISSDLFNETHSHRSIHSCATRVLPSISESPAIHCDRSSNRDCDRRSETKSDSE